jgi:hypothetical protein
MALTFPALVVVPLAAVAVMAATRRWEPIGWELLAVPLGIAAHVGLAAGGDFLPMARLLVPALPFMALLVGLTVRDLLATGAPAARPAALAWTALLVAISLPPAFDVHLVPSDVRFRFRIRHKMVSEYAFWKLEKERTQRWALTGRELALHAEPGDSLVIGSIGAIGYHSRLFIYDSFGLVNREVARRSVSDAEVRNPWRPPGHHKGVPREFFLPKRPTFLDAVLIKAPVPDAPVPGYRTVFYPIPPERASGPERLLRVLRRVD